MPEDVLETPPSSDIAAIFKEADDQQASFLSKADEIFKANRGDYAPADPPAPKEKPAPVEKPKEKPSDQPKSKSAVADPPFEIEKTDAVIPNEEDIPRELTGVSKARSAQWAKLHEKNDAAVQRAVVAEARAKELETRLSSAPKADPAIEGQLVTLQKERDEYARLLESVAAERSPRFQQQFQPRVEAAINLAKQAVGPELASKVEQLLQLPDSEFRNTQLEEIIGNLGTLRANKLGNAVGEMDRITSERQSLASKGHELYQRWTQESQEKQRSAQADMQKRTKEAFESEVASWQKGVPLFQPKDNDAAHNASVQERVAQARNIFSGGLSETELARASMWAVAGQHMVASAQAISKENAALKTELAALKAAKPGIPAPGGKGSEDSDVSDKFDSYGGLIAHLVRNEGLNYR